MDRLYTSISIARWLLDNQVTMIGTLMLNRRGIPADLKDISHREILSNEVFYEMDGNINLTSYVVKTSKGKKNMMLSTVFPLTGITMDDDKQKPALYKLYDFTKGALILSMKVWHLHCKAKV